MDRPGISGTELVAHPLRSVGRGTPAEHTSPLPQPPEPFIPRAADCDNCGGGGWIFPGGDGQGPWKDKEPVRCPLCKGTGKV